MKVRLYEFAKICAGTLCDSSDGDTLLTSVSSDSRKCLESDNTLFAAFKGDRFDGHEFVKDVVANKTCAAIIDDEKYVGRNTLLVSNVKKALYTAAIQYRYNDLMRVMTVAVTGSVGKTTVKDMIYSCIAPSLKSYKSPGNQNSLTGLPMAVLNMDGGLDCAVLELGMNQPMEISRLSILVRPRVAVITNIGYSHIASFGSIEGIRDEKLDIISGMEHMGKLILNGDDKLLRNADINGTTPIYYSVFDRECDVYADSIVRSGENTKFNVNAYGKKYCLSINAVGMHNVSNAIASFTAALSVGADDEKAVDALAEYVPASKRLETYQTDGKTIISDCYNASPSSMKSALDVLDNSDVEGKRVAVLGDMLELGDFSEKLHRLVGSYVAESKANTLVCFGNDAPFIADEARKDGFVGDIVLFAAGEYDKASDYLRGTLNKGDAVLFKASNRMRLSNIEEGAFGKRSAN